MIKFADSTKLDPRTEERVRRIVDLSHRRDRILEASMLDMEALAVLAADYEAAHMPCAAVELRRRLEHYRERFGKERKVIEPRCPVELGYPTRTQRLD